MQKGFSLIETVIYIALLSLIMTGAVAVSYQIVSNSQSLSAKNTAGEEGNFVLRKLASVLSGAQAITAPSTWGTTLSVARYDGTTVDMRLNGEVIELRRNSGTYEALTTGNVKATMLGFTYLPASGASPAGVEASTTVNGMTFYAKYYLRK